MNSPMPDEKTQSILQAAWDGFSAYGFRKTSMDDIARGAGMSRPALYLRFKNKEAIFRALVEAFYLRASSEISAALQAEGSLKQKLSTAFAAHGGETMEAMMASAHGMELLEASMSHAGEVIEAGEAGLRRIYTDWLAKAAAEGNVRLSAAPKDLAQLFCAGLKGVKHTSGSYPEYRQGVSNYAILCAEALRP